MMKIFFKKLNFEGLTLLNLLKKLIKFCTVPILLIIIIFPVISLAAVNSFPYNMGFETGPSGTDVNEVDWTMASTAIDYKTTRHSGSFSAGASISTTGDNSRNMTVDVDFSGRNNVSVSFWYRLTGTGISMQVQGSTNGGSSFFNLKDWFNPSTTGTWVQLTNTDFSNLSNFNEKANSQIRIRAKKDTASKTLYIDDFYINSAVAGGGGEEHLTITKTANPAYNIHPNDVNVPVLAFNIIDTNEGGTHTVARMEIGNAGSANSADIASMKIYYDSGALGVFDSDLYVADLYYSTSQNAWTNFNLSSQMTNYLIVVDIAGSATDGHTIQSYIPIGGIQCSAGSNNSSAITNNNIQTIYTNIAPGDVVINEIMWMGANSSADEWVELRNMTGKAVNFNAQPWTLYQVGTATPEIVINYGVLEANGYFLIANYDANDSQINVNPDVVNSDISLSDSSLQLKLYIGTGSNTNLIDTAWDGSDPGTRTSGTSNDPFYSIVRNDNPGDGSSTANWYNATNSTGWDPPATNVKGTPGFDNTPDSISPSAITNLTASTTNTNGGVVLHWTAPGDDGWTGTVSGYYVRYSFFPINTTNDWDNAYNYEGAGQWYNFIPANNDETRIVAYLPAHTAYYFAVRAFDEGGNLSPIGNSTIATTYYDYDPPAAITNLQVISNYGAGQIAIAFTAPGDDGWQRTAKQYIVKWSTNAINNDTDFSNATTYAQSWTPPAGGSDEMHVLSGLPGNKIVYVAIKVVDEAGNTSGLSNPASGRAGETDPPVIISATASDDSSAGIGIQTGDIVTIIFNESTGAPDINSANIDTVLQLSSSHTWLNGSGSISNARWTNTTYANDTLIITLSTNGGTPTVTVGDTITCDGATISDLLGNPCSDSTNITGTFGADITAPTFVSAIAYDTGGADGLNPGDTVVIKFSETMDTNTKATILANIDSALRLNTGGHSWGGVASVDWSSGDNPYDTLTITFSDGTGTIAIGDNIDNTLANSVQDDGPSFNDVTGNVTLSGSFGGDTKPPAMISAVAKDASAGGPGIQSGDQVIVTFDEGTTGYNITSGNINTVLNLGGHSWLDGNNNIDSAVWKTNVYPNDTLIITLTTAVSTPTVVVGDTITIGANTIEDAAGNDATGGTITGSFGNNGPGSCSVQPSGVAANDNTTLLFTLTGENPYTIVSNVIDINTNWTWTGSLSDVSNYGPGFNVTGCTLSIVTNAPDQYSIKIWGAQVTASAVGYIKLFNMTAPKTPQTTVFKVYTAASNNSLQEISSHPYVIVSAAADWWNAYFNLTPYNDDFETIFINYCDAAKYKMDISYYNINRDNILNAIKAAADRGVKIRIITDHDNLSSFSGVDGYAGNIKVIDDTFGANTGNGIMHNKFVVFDYGYPGTDSTVENLVWGGSHNFTSYMLNSANNVFTIKNHSMASNYTVEFNEMWGSSTFTPNSANSKFGSNKTDNTRHFFEIGTTATNVESYFSPSDGVNAEIEKAVKSADYNIYFCIFTFSAGNIAQAILDRFNAGVKVAGVWDEGQTSQSWDQYDDNKNLLNNIGAQYMITKKNGFSGMMHDKYMIIDAGHPESDPIVITGSHNWTGSADTINDENTWIIHDPQVAQKYYAEFLERFGSNPYPAPASATINTTPGMIVRNSTGNKLILTVTHDGSVTDNLTDIKVLIPSTWPSIVDSGNTTITRGDGYNYSANNQVNFTSVAGGTEIEIVNADLTPSGTANHLTITINNMTAPSSAGESLFTAKVSTPNITDGQIAPSPQVMVKKCALLITEVAFAGGGGSSPYDSADWVELYMADDGNNGAGCGLNGFTLTSEDGSPLKTISSATLHTGKYAVILFNNSTPDETSDSGAVLNVYTTSAGLTGTDEQVDIYDDSGYMLDAVCWANQNGTWSSGEDSDVSLIAKNGEWKLAGATPAESDCVDSSVVNSGVSICRLTGGSLGDDGYIDSQHKSDWAIDSSPTPGTINSATGNGGTANPGDVVINEIMYDPATSDSYCEWFELYNTRSYDIDLSGWKWIVGNSTNTINSGIISGNGYFVVVAKITNASGDDFETDFGDGSGVWGNDTTYEVYTPYKDSDEGWISLANSGATIKINDGANDIDSVTYDSTWGGQPLSGTTNVSLERKDPFGPSNDANNWGSCVSRWTPYQPHQGTPGSQNSLAGGNNQYICINEVYFEDNDFPDRDEWVEIYNRNTTANISLAGWTLTDYDGNVYTFPSDCIIPPLKYVVVHFNSQGTDDLDFSDGKGDLFTGDTTDILGNNDEVGLYSGATRNPTTLIDFVAWSSNGIIAESSADEDAISATNKNYATWQSNQAVKVDTTPDLNLGRTIYLKQDGITTNGVTDWAFSSSTNAKFFYSEGYPNISSDTNVQKNISNLSIYSSQSDPTGDTVRIGEQFYIRLTTSSDPSPGEKTITTVRVTSSSNDKINGITVTLVETGSDTGIFEGWVKVDSGTSDDPLQWIKAGTLETIKVWWSGDSNYFDTIQVAGSSAEDIVINEFVPNPYKSDNSQTNTHLDDEWIEIYNKGIIAHDLSDWTIRLDNGKSYTIPSSVAGSAPVLSSKGYLYIHFEDNYDTDPSYPARQDINLGSEIHIFEGHTTYSSNTLNQDYGYGGGIALYSSTNNSIDYLVDYIRYASIGTGNYTHYLRAITKGIWNDGDYINTSGRKNIVGQLTALAGDSYYPSYGRKTDGLDSNSSSDWHWAIKRAYRTDNGGDTSRWPLYGGQATSTNNMDYTPPPDVQITSVQDTTNDRGGAITVKWIPVNDDNQGFAHGVQGYAVFYSAGGSFNDCNNAILYPDSPIKNSTADSCNIQGLEDGKQYWFAVVAIDSNNNFDLLTQSSLSGVTPVNNLGIGNIVFNEIQYNPKSGSGYYQREFIELYNRGTNAIDLAGWYLVDPSYGDKYYIIPASTQGETSTVLETNGYATILGKTTEVPTQTEMSPLGPNSSTARWFYLRHQNASYKWVTNTGCGPGKYGSFSTETLNNDWETAELYDASGNLVDVVTYGQNWSTVGYKQSGGSMSKLDPDLPSTDPDSWGESFHTTQSNGTPCRPNAPNEPPMCEITSPNAYVWFGSNVNITVHAEETNSQDKINYNDEIDVIELQYSLNSTTGLDGDWYDIEAGLYDINNSTNVTFTTNWKPTSPPHDTDDLVWIRARARDTRFRYSDWTTISLQQRVKIDNQAPIYTNWGIKNITADSAQQDTCIVQVDVNDNNGTGLSGSPQLKYYYVNAKGVTNWGSNEWDDMTYNNGYWHYAIPSPGDWISYAGGYIYFKVKAQDVIGNKSISSTMSEYIDRAADHIELKYTDGIAPINGTEIVSLQVKDSYGTNVANAVIVTNKVSGGAKILATTLSNAVFNSSSNIVYGYTHSKTGSATITVGDSIAETIVVTPNSTLIGSSTTPDRDIGTQVVFKCGPLDHFVIIHDNEAWVNQNAQVIVQAIDTYGNLKTDFTGTVALGCSGMASGEIVWSADSSAKGTLTDGGTGNETATYTFNSSYSDSGSVTLFIKSDTADTVNISASNNGKYDDDSEGLLEFQGFYPPLYVTSIRLFDDLNYANDITNAPGGTVIYIQALGYDQSPTTQDKMFVTVTSSTSDTPGITVELTETGKHTSEFRGYVTLKDVSDSKNRYIAAQYPGEIVTVTSTITNLSGSYENDSVTIMNTEPSTINQVRFVQSDYFLDLDTLNLFGTAYLRLDAPLSAANQYTRDYTYGVLTSQKNTTGFTVKLIETGPNTGEYRANVVAGTNTDSASIPQLIECNSTGDIIRIESTVDSSMTDTCIITNHPIEPTAITNISFLHDMGYSIPVDGLPLVGGSRVFIKAKTALSNDGNPLYQDYVNVNIRSFLTSSLGITISLHETGLHTGIYTNWIDLGATSSGAYQRIGANTVGETVRVMDTISSNTDSFVVANTPLGMIDDFDDGTEPNEADGNIYDLNSGTHSYNNTTGDHTPIVTNGYALQVNFSAANAGVSLYLSGFDASDYGQISFAKKGSTGNEDIGIRLKDRNGNTAVKTINNIGSTWSLSTYNIPADFGGVDIQNLYSIEFYATGGSGTFYIDDVQFTTPTPISTVTIYSSDYTTEITNAKIGDQIYIQLIGATTNTNTIDNTIVVLKSDCDVSNGIRVLLTETGRQTGIYRGTATIAQTTSDAADQIKAHAGDFVYVISPEDTAKTDKILIKPNSVSYFILSHDGNANVGVWEPITLTAYDMYDDIVTDCTNTVKLFTKDKTNTSEVDWNTNSGNHGTFSNAGAGLDWAYYTFSPADSGIAHLLIKDDTAENLDPEVISLVGGYTDIDSAPQFINFVSSSVVLKIFKSVISTTLNGSPSPIIPGATITYQLSYTNTTANSGNNVIIYDKLPYKYVTYRTNSYSTTASGWTIEWSTNTNPNQHWNSSDYVSSCPAFHNIKWIRWKKNPVSPNEGTSGNNTLEYQVIVK